MNKFDCLKNLTSKIGSGATPTGGQSNYKISGVSLVRSQNVLDMRFSKDGLAFIDDAQASKLNNVKVQENDILLNITGDSIARVCKVPKEILPARVNQHVSIIRTNGKIDADYLLYYLIFRKNYLLTISRVGGTRNALTKDAIEEIQIRVDDKDKKIASVLSALDDKIKLNNKINTELEAMAKTLYNYWFVQFDFPDADGRPYKSSGGEMVYDEVLKREIPKGWRVKSFGDVISKIESGKRPKGGIDKSLKFGIPSLGAESIDKLGYFDYTSTKYIPFEYKNRITSGIVQNNDILIYKDGAYVGKTTLFRDGFPFEFTTINEHVFLVRSKNSNMQEYLLFTLMQNYYFNIMQSLGQKAAQPGLNQNDFKNIKIIVPKEECLDDFNKFVDTLFNKLFLNSKQNQELASLRDWLLPMLMNGQVTVKDAYERIERELGMVSEAEERNAN